MHLHSRKHIGSRLGLNMPCRCSGSMSRQVSTWRQGLGSIARDTLLHIAHCAETAPLHTLHQKTQMYEKSYFLKDKTVTETFKTENCYYGFHTEFDPPLKCWSSQNHNTSSDPSQSAIFVSKICISIVYKFCSWPEKYKSKDHKFIWS
jgi:hypothetical protein